MGRVPEPDYDVAIVGASLAGSTAATLYGRQGLRVALIERHSDPRAFKRVCTHLIQASATPMLRRHGLDRLIEENGGIRYRLKIWTRWGWILPPQFAEPDISDKYGYNIRRETLDPMLRTLAAGTPGVDLRLGSSVEGLLRDGDRVTGVVVRNAGGDRQEISARLVVGADGRNSKVAELTGTGAWTIANNRVAYGAYYRNLPEGFSRDAHLWFLEPDVAYTFPTDDGQTILATMFPKDKLPLLRAKMNADFPSIFSDVPGFPSFEGAEMVGNLIGMSNMPNQWRKRPPAGLAFVGDAAVAADPIFGVGCGWALQSAEWLVETTAGALGSGRDAGAAARRYGTRLRKGLLGHYLMISDYSRARLFNPGERLLFSGAARDSRTAYRLGELASRSAPARGFFSPVTMARAARVNLAHRGEEASRPRGLGDGRSEIVVDGIRTPLIQAGPASAAEAVVFVHGNPGSSEDFDDLVAKAGRFSRAIAVDMPGFGTADKPKDFDYSVGGYARHFAKVLEQLGVRRAHLVLHDFGAAWGLQWAVDHPDAAASVTLLNVGILQDYSWHYLAKIWRTPVAGEIFNAAATIAAFRLLLKHGNRKGLPPKFVDRMYRDFDAGTKRAVLKLYRATGPEDFEAMLEPVRALNLPALVIWGARDPYLPLKQAQLQRNAFPDARIEVLPESGHWPFADDPQQVAGLVLPFLQEQLAAGVPANP